MGADQGIDIDRVAECKKAIKKGYKDTTIIPKVSKISIEKSSNISYQSIGIRRIIKKEEFNDNSYFWSPYFSQVGRVVAYGEQKYLQRVIGKYVRSDGKKISLKDSDFSILEKTISNMCKNNRSPDTILAPLSIYSTFVQKYYFPPYHSYDANDVNLFNIADTQVRILWSNKYAELRSFVIFNSKYGVWCFQRDAETDENITIAIGESIQYPGKVEYWVETLANYQIKNPYYYQRINLSY